MSWPDAAAAPRDWPATREWQAVAGREFLPADWPHRDTSSLVCAGPMRWHVQRRGQGPRLLLIHGTAASTHTWRGILPMLAEHFDVLAMDLPGHGYTQRLPNRLMSLPALAGGIHELLAAIDFDPRYVAGHSAGAAVALRMALDRTIRPDAVIGLNAALLPFGGPFKQLFAPLARFFANTRLMPRMVARRARDIRAVQRVLDGTGSKLDHEGVRLYQHLLQRDEHVAAVLAMMASWNLDPLLEALPQLRMPLHLLVGENDKAVRPREADSIASVLPRTTVTRLAACGHLAHEEAPELVARFILDTCDAGAAGHV